MGDGGFFFSLGMGVWLSRDEGEVIVDGLGGCIDFAGRATCLNVEINWDRKSLHES